MAQQQGYRPPQGQTPQGNPGQPVDAGGKPAPPLVPVPGAPDVGWKWSPDPNNSRGGTWTPDGKVQGGGNPNSSWDDNPGPKGVPHWDVKDGKGGTRRYTEGLLPQSTSRL